MTSGIMWRECVCVRVFVYVCVCVCVCVCVYCVYMYVHMYAHILTVYVNTYAHTVSLKDNFTLACVLALTHSHFISRIARVTCGSLCQFEHFSAPA